MITFILGLLIGAIAMFLIYLKQTKEIAAKTIADILEDCVEKIELHEWGTEKIVEFLNNAANKLKNKK
ncbi:hypothetical protein RZO27_09335 [Lactococcus lactis]|uniref:Phage protein n=1 Tax=Lactococcus lactis TaxID=1358 RepID=A0ABD5GSW6_9LACT|nr:MULTISPECIES: hypothetical protein [Lactococcus]MCT0509709.1 hypothetical protein [Lactococcus cremoris]MDV2619316.1 hypothetical protein [Lactococcus lactis]